MRAEGFRECDHCGGQGLESKRLELLCGKCHGIGAIRKDDADPLCEHGEPPRICFDCDPTAIDRFLTRPLDNP